MIGRTNVGGVSGSSKISKVLTLQGAVGETINIKYDDVDDNVLLDSDGTNQYVLVSEDITNATFTGSISGYVTNIAILDSTPEEVKVMPDKAVYWYGNLCGYDWTNGAYYGWNGIGSVSSLTFNKNSIYCYNNSSGIAAARIENTTMIPTKDTSSINIIMETSVCGSSSYAGVDIYKEVDGAFNRWINCAGNIGTTFSKTKVTETYTNVVEESVLQIRCQSVNTSVIHAIWFE